MKKINKQKFKILAIESSCDETAAAVIELMIVNKKLTGVNNSYQTQPILTNISDYYPLLTIQSNVVSSQVKLHAAYGGVYPELASREHIKNIIPVIKQALCFKTLNSKSETLNKFQVPSSKIPNKSQFSNNQFQNIDAIAVTTGPGLIGSLLVGVNTAKTLAYTLNKPIYAINHLEGHIYSAFGGESLNSKSEILNKFQITNNKFQINSNFQNPNKLKSYKLQAMPKFPILALVVSGGHTSLVYMKNHFDYKVIGETLDDAAGEAFDKVAKLLGLGYPGGPAISALAEKFSIYNSQFSNKSQISDSNFQNPKKLQATSYKLIKFPRPMINEDNFDFSFSGLKTAVLYTVNKLKTKNEKRKTKSEILNFTPSKVEELKSEICFEFQKAVVDTLVIKTLRAAAKYGVKSILLCGGVSANSRLRQEFELKIKNLKLKIDFFVPQKNLSTDNAAMIGIAGAYRMALGKKPTAWYDVNADSNQKLF